MEKSKDVLGEGHPDTLTSINNLAATYMYQERWEEAETMQIELLKKRCMGMLLRNKITQIICFVCDKNGKLVGD